MKKTVRLISVKTLFLSQENVVISKWFEMLLFFRWYDKTVQLIISPDGTHGLSYEHSASEGIAVIALIEHLLNYM